jgi:hypothetical protein
MLGTTSGSAKGLAHYSMQIECPQCAQKMIVHVGLIGNPKEKPIECVGCHNNILPLLPGPIVDGPFTD